MESAIKDQHKFFWYVYKQFNVFFYFLFWLQVILNEIYQRIVELEINVKMLVPCQSALVLLR